MFQLCQSNNNALLFVAARKCVFRGWDTKRWRRWKCSDTSSDRRVSWRAVSFSKTGRVRPLPLWARWVRPFTGKHIAFYFIAVTLVKKRFERSYCQNDVTSKFFLVRSNFVIRGMNTLLEVTGSKSESRYWFPASVL